MHHRTLPLSAFDRAIAQVRLHLRRGLWVLATTASITPWLGLLLTAIAIIFSFQGVTGSAHAFPSAMFEALAQALVPTFWGLLIGIPTHWIYHYLNNRCDTLCRQLYAE